MYAPAGYEDSDDSDYDTDYFSTVTVDKHEPRELTPEEKHKALLDNLTKSVYSGNNSFVIKQLDEDFDVNTIINDGYTLILLAATNGNSELVIELIKRGADVNIAKDMYTPLMAACACSCHTVAYEKSFIIVEELLKHNADVHVKNKKRMTPLMFAAHAGNYEAVKTLLPLSNKDAVDYQGWTALFWAIDGEHKEIIELLLEANLDKELCDARQLNVLHYAKNTSNSEIIKLFPDPDADRKVLLEKNSSYDFHEEMKTSHFKSDVLLMLNGMKCAQLIDLFQKSGVDLLSFLTLSREDLKQIGVTFAYQQERILGGLYRFHKEPYKMQSVTVVTKNETYSTIHIMEAIFACHRHVITMRASLKYIKPNYVSSSNSEFKKIFADILNKVVEIRRNIRKLKKRTKVWDEDIKVMLIPRQKPVRSKYLKFITVALAGLFIYATCFRK